MAIDLAVSSDGPTRQRLHRHLPSYGIAVHHFKVGGGIVDIDGVDVHATSRYDVGFVFPSRIVEGDVAASVLAIPWVNDRDAILTTRNKAGSLSRLAADGIPIPRTVHVSSPVDETELIDAYRTFDGPVVLKPNATTRGVGHVLIRDVDSLRGTADYLDLVHSIPTTRDRSFLLQAYVPDARDLRLTVIEGVVAGAVERRLVSTADDEWVKNVHRGAVATAVDPPADAVSLAEQAAGRLDVPFLGVDILDTDGGPIVLEVNGRPTIDRVEKYPSDFYERLAALIETTASDA